MDTQHQTQHKFRVGQKVAFDAPSLQPAALGPYEIVRLLPHDGNRFHYRIKSVAESHERVAAEDQLTAARS